MWEGDVPSETERILVKGLMDFPKRIVRQILSGPDRARFVVNLSNKVLLRTYYSGMGSEGIVLHWLANAVRAEEPALIPDDAVCWYSSCDKQSLARRVLGKYGSLGPQHVFGDMLARHDKETCATLDAVKWPADTKKRRRGSEGAQDNGKTKQLPAGRRKFDHGPIVCGSTSEEGDEDDVCDIVSVRIAKVDDGRGGSEEAHVRMEQALDAIFETNRILAEPGAFKETDSARCGG